MSDKHGGPYVESPLDRLKDVNFASGDWAVIEIDQPDIASYPFPADPSYGSLNNDYDIGEIIDAADLQSSVAAEYPAVWFPVGGGNNDPVLGQLYEYKEEFYQIGISLGDHPPLGFLWEPFFGGQGLVDGIAINHYSHTHSDGISLAMQNGYNSMVPSVGEQLDIQVAAFNADPTAGGYFDGGTLLGSGVVECILGSLYVINQGTPDATIACSVNDGSAYDSTWDETDSWMSTYNYRTHSANLIRQTYILSLGALADQDYIWQVTFPHTDPHLVGYRSTVKYTRYKGLPVFTASATGVTVEGDELVTQTIQYPYDIGANDNVESVDVFKITRAHNLESLVTRAEADTAEAAQ